MTEDRLMLYLRGDELGEVQRLRNGRLRLRFTAGALDRWGEGARPLSLSLPLTPQRVHGATLDRFLDNLLPEGPSRAALERELGVAPHDTFGMLAKVGAECAGAIQLMSPDTVPGSGHLRPLSHEELVGIVEDLPTLTPPDDLAVTASLGGIQAKVLLHRSDAGWCWPADGAISTHIVKPEPLLTGGVPGLVSLEHWTLTLAQASGLPAAQSELVELGGREAIIVERFDRRHGRRIHQEDFAQALGIAAADKYEGSGQAPGRLTAVVRAAGSEAIDYRRLRQDILRLVTFNTVIGNGDAHAKNYSLTIDEEATFRAAPLYDAAPVYLVNSAYRHSGMAVAGRNRLDLITAQHLVDEAMTWGMPEDDAREAISSTAGQIAEAVAAVADVEAFPHLRERVLRRAEALHLSG